MKLYSVAGNRRYKAILGFIAASVALTVFGYDVVEKVPLLKSIFEIDTGHIGTLQFAALALFGLILPFLYYLTDEFLWRLPILNRFLGVPDLNGQWIGIIERTNYPEVVREEGIPVFMVIEQTYFRMSIKVKNISPETLSGITFSNTQAIDIEGDFDSGFVLNLMFEVENKEGGRTIGANRLLLDAKAESHTLSGEYVSSFPRVGNINVTRVHKNEKIQLGNVKPLTSQSNERYFGISIDSKIVRIEENKLNRHLGVKEFSEAKKNRENRDGPSYHLTIITPLEVGSLSKEHLKLLNDLPEMSFVPQKVGHAVSGDNECWFITVHSPHGDYLRKQVGLPKKDFHITLGFRDEDVHDRPKDHTRWIQFN